MRTASPPAPPRPVQPPALQLIRERRPVQPSIIIASTDEMIRWLRSRDFMVLHHPSGWQVDRHVLDDEAALLEFVNTRRLRLNPPPFVNGHGLSPSLPPLALPAAAPARAAAAG